MRIVRQRELSWLEALETATHFHRTEGLDVPRPGGGQDTPISEGIAPSVPRNTEWEEPCQEHDERSIPIGLVQPTQLNIIVAGHPDIMYQNIFPAEMNFSNQNAIL